jgi:SSS family solute:Na+ symporter
VLILGGLTVMLLGLHKLGVLVPEYGPSVIGGFKAVLAGSPEKFHMVRPASDPELPWPGVFFGGMWLANIFYWGCNQFITQRTLAAKSVWHGQMGVVFAGFLKLLVPFLVVLPGIVAFRLYNPDSGLLKAECVLLKADLAFPTLVKQLLPHGLTGLVMAGLMGCVMSHVASMMSASSSILTFDIYKNYVKRDASSADLVRFGRITSVSVLVAATVVGYFLQDLKGIFIYIQEFWSIAYPSVCALFLAGFFYQRATARGAFIAIIAGPLWAMAVTMMEKMHRLPHIPYLSVWSGTGADGHWLIPFLTRGAIDFLFAFFILWLFRNRGEIEERAIIDRSFPPEVLAEMRALPFYQRFSFWSTILIACVVALYIRFF